MNKLLSKISTYIQNLSKKEFEKYLKIFLALIFLIITLSVYFIYNNSVELVSEIKNLKKTIEKTNSIKSKNDAILKEEARFKELTEKNSNFKIQTFFEDFNNKQNLKPEPWDTTTSNIEGNDSLEEISIQATFKNQNMQKLTTVLDALSKEEIIYLKNVNIKGEGEKQITFSITIATIKQK